MGLPAGDYSVSAEMPYFENQTVQVQVYSGETVIQDFVLDRLQWELHIGVEGAGTTIPVPGSHMVEEGLTVQVEPLPDSGWMLHHWVLDTVETEPFKPIFVNMDSHHVLTAVFTELPMIESCNSMAGRKDVFELGETVYMHGNGFSPSSGYSLYVVVDQEVLTEGMIIPERVAGTEPGIFSNVEGGIDPTAVWHNPQTVGNYDIIIDVNGNGQYDSELDVLDDNDTEVTAGYIIIPEFPSYLILPLLMIITLLVVTVHKSRSKKGNYMRARS
jgi:hypothetical protein